MDEHDRLAERFEAHRGRLRAVAHRMLGSLGDADDAVQETWLRLDRVDAGRIDNLAAWLTTVVSRVCLDMLRARAARREDPAGQLPPDLLDEDAEGSVPEEEALLIESVGRALLVVLDRLSPAERVAFVLHDTLALPFSHIAPIVGRTPVAAKKLASRARHRVRGTTATAPNAAPAPSPLPARDAASAQHRRLVEAFLAAARGGDVDALLAVLAPEAVRRADAAALPPGVTAVVGGARAVARQAGLLAHRSRYAEFALVDGAPGAVVAPRGRLVLALAFTFAEGRITGYEVIAERDRLRRLVLAVPPV